MTRGNIRIYFIKNNDSYLRASTSLYAGCLNSEFLSSTLLCKRTCKNCNITKFNEDVSLLDYWDMVAIPVRFIFLINEKEET